MKRTIRTGMTGALLLGGVAAVAAVGMVRPSGDPVPPAANDLIIVPQAAGDVIITTHPDGSLVGVSYDADGVDGPGAAQAASVDLSRKCVVTINGGPITMSIVGYSDGETTLPSQSPSQIGLVSNGLGSSDGKNCNSGNGLVESGQALVVALNDTFPQFVGKNVRIESADLDVEGKHGADLVAEAKIGNIVQFTVEDPLGTPISDNGCDSFQCDNHPVQVIDPNPVSGVSKSFTRLLLAPVNGELAVEGGGDYPDTASRAANRTVLHLTGSTTYEYEFKCAASSTSPAPVIIETATGSGWGPTDAETADPSKIEIFRYPGWVNTNGVYASGLTPKACGTVYGNVNGDLDNVVLEPSNDNAFLRVRVTWEIPVAALGGSLPGGNDASDSAFDRHIDLQDGAGPKDAQYCEGFDPLNPTDPALGTFNPTTAGRVNHLITDGTTETFVPWCVLSDTRVIVGDKVVQTMVWDGLGDPKWL